MISTEKRYVEDKVRDFEMFSFSNRYNKMAQNQRHLRSVCNEHLGERGVELISNGAKNMNLSSTYHGQNLQYTGGSLFKYDFQTSALKLLQNNPYNAQGYLNKTYNLPTPKK